MPALELDFVEIRTRDRAGLTAWYIDALGLTLALDDSAGDFTLLDAGTMRLALRGGRDETGSGSIGLAFRVEDIESMRSGLIARGVSVSGPFDSPEGYRAIRLVDPMGHPIQLFQWIS